MSLSAEFRNFLHIFIESLPYGVMVLSQDGTVIDINRNFSFMFNVGLVKHNETHYSQIFNPKTKTLLDQIIEDLTTKGFVMGKEAILTLDSGMDIAVALSASQLLNEDPVLRDNIIICREMSARQELDRMRELERLKSEFVSSITHDLKAPLTSVIGYADLLLETAQSKLDKDELEFVGVIKQEGLRLTRMINDILNVAKIESGGLQLKPELIHIASIIDEVLVVAKVQAQHFKFSIELDNGLVPLWLDKEIMTRVIMNLVSNAIKYSPRGGCITLKCSLQDANVVIDVVDQGLGMSEDSLAHLFEKFFRVRTDATQGIAGTGLGLVITKGFIEAHGGTIKVKSKLGQGSTFSVVLPIRLATQKPV